MEEMMTDKQLAITCQAPELLMTFDEVISEIARVFGLLKEYTGGILDRDFAGKKQIAELLASLDALYDRAEELANAN